MVRDMFIIILLFSIILLYLKKYFHLLIIIVPYLTTIGFSNIKNTNQGKEILDIFLIFLIMLYILISVVSRIFQKYIDNKSVKKLNIISIGVIWIVLSFGNITIELFNNSIIFDVILSFFNIITILYLLRKEIK